MVGASVSLTVTVKEQVAVLPEPSVTVKPFEVVPEGKLDPLAKPAVCAKLDPAQLSLKLTEYVTIAAHWPGSLLTTTLAGQVMVGISVSLTVTVKEQVAVLPEPSVTVKLLAVVPEGKLEPLAKPDVCAKFAPAQLSLKVTEKVTIAAHWPGSLLTTTFAGHVMVGTSVSLTVTVKEQAAVLLEPSVTVKLFEGVSEGELEPLAKPDVCAKLAPAQLSLKLTE